MSPQLRNGLIVTAVIGIAGFAAWKYFLQNKKAYVNILVKKNVTTGSTISLLTFDEGFLKAWAKAAKKGEAQFAYNSKQYKTEGGKAV